MGLCDQIQVVISRVVITIRFIRGALSCLLTNFRDFTTSRIPHLQVLGGMDKDDKILMKVLK